MMPPPSAKPSSWSPRSCGCSVLRNISNLFCSCPLAQLPPTQWAQSCPRSLASVIPFARTDPARSSQEDFHSTQAFSGRLYPAVTTREAFCPSTAPHGWRCPITLYSPSSFLLHSSVNWQRIRCLRYSIICRLSVAPTRV